MVSSFLLLSLFFLVSLHFSEEPDFISTGKELRDMPTLIKAFNTTEQELHVYTGRNTGGVNYEQVFANIDIKPNIHIHYIQGLVPYELSKVVNRAACVAICCQKSNYTVGLTTVVEALALGIPIICSRNPQMPMNIDTAGIGITVDYADTEGWEKAINYIVHHPEEAREMGRKGRELAEKYYNLELCASNVAALIRGLDFDKHK